MGMSDRSIAGSENAIAFSISMLERLVEGRYYVIDVAGNPFFIETPLDLELARAQLGRMHFGLSPDPDTGRFTLVPADLNPDKDLNPPAPY